MGEGWGRARGLRVLTILLAVALVGSACGGGGGGGGGEPRKITVLLPYQDSIAFIGLLIAKDRYFEEEGLTVETLPSEGASFVTQQLIAGQVTYGVTTAQAAVIAASQGAELKAISLLDRDVFTIATPEDSSVASIEDLGGGALGITEFGGGEVPLVNAVLEDAGLVAGEDVELLPVGPGGPAVFEALQSGKILAYAGATNDLAGVEVAGITFRSILPEKFQNLPTNTLIITQDTLEDEDSLDAAIRLARAWHKGTVFAYENPEAALKIACGLVPEECENMAVALAFLEVTLRGVVKQEGLRWGEHDLSRWQTVLDSLAAADLEGPVDVEDVAINYVDEINDFDEEAVRAEAREA